jgi:hypothetical protein
MEGFLAVPTMHRQGYGERKESTQELPRIATIPPVPTPEYLSNPAYM